MSMIIIYRVVRPGLIIQGVKAYCKTTMKQKAPKPQFNYIDINTIESDIDNCVIEFMTLRNIDIYDINQCRTIPHNVLTLCMMSIYNKLFKPNHGLYNNQKSLIDYDNVELLSVIANKFIQWSLHFDKSMGLMQFSIMTGIHRVTLAEWRDNRELNSARSDIINNICECHKMEQIGLLNNTPVGALAVANNDVETGLQWSANQTQQITANTVYLIPSERSNRLALEDNEQS